MIAQVDPSSPSSGRHVNQSIIGRIWRDIQSQFRSFQGRFTRQPIMNTTKPSSASAV
jgi:hypothetical protein